MKADGATAEDSSTPKTSSVNATRLKGILEEFELKVDLGDLGLSTVTDAEGNDMISFDQFREFTALTPSSSSLSLARALSLYVFAYMVPPLRVCLLPCSLAPFDKYR